MPDDNQTIPRDWKSTPDPSSLTTEQLRRELSNLEDKLLTRINGDMSAILSRLQANDKATELFDANLHRIPTETQQAVTVLKDLQNEQMRRLQETIVATEALTDEKFRRTDEEKATAHATLNAEILRCEVVGNEKLLALHEIINTKSASNTEASTQFELSVERRFGTVNNEIRRVEEYSKERILAITDIINAKAEASQAAIIKAEQATEKRFEVVSEFQQSLGTANNTFATRSITDSLKEQIALLNTNSATRESLDSLKEIASLNTSRISNIDGKMFAYASVAGLLATILAAFFSYIGHITSVAAINHP